MRLGLQNLIYIISKSYKLSYNRPLFTTFFNHLTYCANVNIIYVSNNKKGISPFVRYSNARKSFNWEVIMKKLITVAASAALVISMAGLTACAGSEGVIKGNYKEPTSEEFTNAVGTIDSNKMFGDTTAEDYKLGLEFATKFNADISLGSLMSLNGTTEAGYKFTMDKKGNYLGSGSFSMNAEAKSETATGTSNDKSKVSAKIYNDSAYVYASATGIEENKETKVKLDINKLIESIGVMSYAEISNDTITEGGNTETEITPEAPELSLEMLKELKINVGLDSSDGVKLKLSVTQDTVWTLLTEELGEETVTVVKEAVTFNAFTFDAYLAIDKDGLFTQASLDFDIDVKADLAKISALIPSAQAAAAPALTGEASVKLDGYILLKSFNGTVTLPEGISDYEDQTDTLLDLINGIM